MIFQNRIGEGRSTFLSAAVIIALCLTVNACKQAPEQAIGPVFKKLAPAESGLRFVNAVDENHDRNYFDRNAYVYNGAGVAVGDINNDSLPDVYFTGNEVPNKLFLNLGGMKFKDITASAGVDGGPGWDNGVTMVDINSDGLLDIYVCKGGFEDADSERVNLLYVNQGNLTFKEEAKAYGLDDNGYSIHSAFFDMDNDNDLDLYLTARPDSFYLGLSRMVSGKQNPKDKCRDKLYRNDDGKFTEIGMKAGINHNFGYALSVVTADLNNDGWMDIFVGNDYADNDYFYINQKNGTFKDEVKTMTNHLSLFSMGADIADLNNDGLEDIMVMEMLPENYKRSKVSMPRMDVEGFWAIVDSGFQKQYMHNVLHLNHGNGFFSDVSQMVGISKTEWSWATLASDFDNDGNRDIFVANGYRRDLFDGDILEKQEMYVRANMNKYASSDEMFVKGFKEYIEIYDPIKVRNYLFKNDGNLKFSNVSEKWGFADSTFSNGAAVADFDNDGDLDLVINNLDGESDLYENINSTGNGFLKVKLEGPLNNQDGIGARISLYAAGKLQQFFQQKTVRGYLSSVDPVVHFGLGAIKALDSMVVVWPDGKSNVVTGVQANKTLTIKYADAREGVPFLPGYAPLFARAEISLLQTPFLHKENKYDEYADQVLLPHEFARSGPFLATGDINGDGLDDFFVGGAKGQAGNLYVQAADKFTLLPQPAFDNDKTFEDIGAAFFDADGDKDLDLYVVSGGSEYADGDPFYQDRLYLNDGRGNFSKGVLPATGSSGSCIATHDFDGDGDLDVFRGGEVMPHKYPYAPKSYLLVNEKGRFADKTDALAPGLRFAGMVKSALWADLDGDKKAELIIAGEWMPVSVFAYEGGKFTDKTESFGLSQTEGWWNKLLASDMDGDGDMDLLAGNLGENYKFQASVQKPFEVYAKDFDNNGTNDIFLAKHLNDIMVPIRGRECTSQQCPVIAKKFPTYLSFAESDLKGIWGDEALKSALHYQARLFSTVIFVNDKGKFKVQVLPWEAQLSTVNGMIVHDFDKDGNMDILVSGNKFDVEVETTPADASPGVFLKGMGKLTFKATKPLESGFFTPWNVKDIQMVRMKDKSVVLVSSNNDALRMFYTKP